MKKLSKHFDRVTEVYYSPGEFTSSWTSVCFQNDDPFEGPFETIEAPILTSPFESHGDT